MHQCAHSGRYCASHCRRKSRANFLGQDLVKTTSCTQQYDWAQGAWQLNQGYSTVQDAQFHVVVYDLGVKRNHLRMLAEQGCKITVVPAQTPASAVLAMQADGVFFRGRLNL